MVLIKKKGELTGMKRPKTSSKRMAWLSAASLFLLAIVFALGVITNANAATGSFDRDKYLPSLSDTNDYDRAFISVTDSSYTTATTDTITVTIKAGSNEIDFELQETGATTTVFTTTGYIQPSQTGVGTTTGYVEDYSGNQLYSGLGTGVIGLSLKSFAVQSGGNASSSTDGVLNVASGDTLQLIYGGSTLDTAAVGFSGANDSSITFTKGAAWGNSASGSASSENTNIIVTINDPDKNLNPKMKDVIGLQDGFTSGLTGTGSSRVQIEALDQTSASGSTLQVGGVDVVARNIVLVETGQNTGIFTAQGKVYGSATAAGQGNLTVGSTDGYSGSVITLGSSTSSPYVQFKIIETNASSGRLGLFYPGTVSSSASAGTATLGFTTGSDFTGFGTSTWSTTKVVCIGANTSAFGEPQTSGNLGTGVGGLVKLIEGSNYCLVQIGTFTATNTGGSSVGDTYETGNAGSVTFSIGSFVLAGPRSGDTIKVSYLDNLTGSGAIGTITSKTNFGQTGETGTISVDKTTVDINDFLTVTVVDGNLNSSSSSRESVASGTWKGTTTNSRGDRLTVKAYSSSSEGVSNRLSLSHPDGSGVGTQTIRISNSDNSLVWVVPTSLTGTFQSPTSFGSTTVSLGTQSTATIPLVKGSTGDAKSFLGGASTSSFVATLDAVDDTVEISPDGTHWIAVPIVETGVNSSTFVGTIGFDCTAARLTTDTTKTAAQTFSDFTGTSTITFFDSPTLTSSIGTGSVVRISDGSFSEIREVTGVTNTVLTVTKMSNSSFFTPWKTWIQVVGNDMSTDRVAAESGSNIFHIGGFYGATYRVRFNEALHESGAYFGGDTLAITTSNVGFQTYTGNLSVSPTGTVGLNSEIVITLVDDDLNISTATAQSTYNDTASIVNVNEVGVGNPAGTSTGNSSFVDGGIAKQIFASRIASITSTDFTNTSNTVSIKLVETDVNTGTFKGTLKLTGNSGSSTSNTATPPELKVSNGDTVTIFYNDSPNATAENNLAAYTTVSVVGSGGSGSLSLSKSEAFLSGDSVVVTLVDNDLNTTSSQDTASVKAKSSSDDSGTNGISLTLTETATNSGSFKGTFTTGASSSGTTVRAVANGNITVTYSDASPAADITAQVSTKNFGAALAITSDPLALGGNAEVSLYDPESNSAIGSANLVNVNITSTTDSSGTTLRLTETGVDTGSFLGTIAVSADSTLSNTRIKAAVGDTITASFTDNPDASGGISTVTDTASVSDAVPTPSESPTPSGSPTPVQTPTVPPIGQGSIAVSVADAISASPIAGATVVLSPGDVIGTTDATGTYTYTGLSAGEYVVVAIADGYSPSAPQPATIPAEGGDVTVSIALQPISTTPVASPTPTTSPTATPACTEADGMQVDQKILKLKRKASGDVTVTVTCEDGGFEGANVKVTVNAAGKKRVAVTPSSNVTDVNGQATFTIKAKNKTGNARITFKSGSLKKSITVKVRK